MVESGENCKADKRTVAPQWKTMGRGRCCHCATLASADLEHNEQWPLLTTDSKNSPHCVN